VPGGTCPPPDDFYCISIGVVDSPGVIYEAFGDASKAVVADFVSLRRLAPGGTCPPPGGLEAVAPSGTCPPLGDLAAVSPSCWTS